MTFQESKKALPQFRYGSLVWMIQNPLNGSPLAFPILECIHIASFALSIGTIALVDFRLLGFGLNKQSPAEVDRDTSLWTLAGIVIIVFSGLLMFSSDPDNYYKNIPFDLKMTFLLLAILFHYTVHRKVVSGSASNGVRKLVGGVSLVLWMCVVFGGIFIGFVNSTLDIHRV